MSIVQGVAVYASSFRAGALLALGGNSGNPIYDVSFIFVLPLLYVPDTRGSLSSTSVAN